ncbi:MAG: ferritin-like domain-containing protein, partial [Algoriella sp.]
MKLLSPENKKKIADILIKLLADEHILYLKTRNAHWNVEGPDFHAAHLFLESQYNELAEIIDEVAERIRQIGHYAVGSY